MSVTVSFAPVYLPSTTTILDGRECTRYDFEGSLPMETRTPGAPELKRLTATIRLRGVEGNNFEILRADYEDVPNVLIAPSPDLKDGEVGVVPSYTFDASAYSANAFYPQATAVLSGIGRSRGVVLGEIALFPLQYNAATRTLRKYQRLVVRVTFGPADERERGSHRPTAGVAINEDAFQSEINATPSKARSATLNSVLASGVWFRFPVNQDGMYRLTGRSLLDAGIPSSVDPGTIKLFGNGGLEVPLDVTAPYVEDLLENTVEIRDAGTAGKLDAEDAVIFFAKGTRGWRYNASSKSFSHYIHHFTETSFYWLTYGGNPARRMVTGGPTNDPFPARPQTVTGRVFREEDKVNLLSSGLEWLGQPFNSGDQITYVHPLNDIDVSAPVTYTYRVGARSSAFSVFSVYEHDQILGTTGIASTNVGSYFANQFINSVTTRQRLPSFTDGRSQLRFAYASSGSGGNGYIDWYEIAYQQFLRARGDVFSFYTMDTTAVLEYAVGGFAGGDVVVYDVSRFDSAQILQPLRVSSDSCVVQVAASGGAVHEIYAVGEGGYKTPSPLVRVANQNLHGDTTEAPYVIITHPEFMSAARRLKSYREQPGSHSLKTLIVDVTQIYNEFGGGSVSPVAIRNYLRYVSSTWQAPPDYVLLFGDGDYDYKRNIVSTPNWIPPWETLESWWPLRTYAGDAEFATFTVVSSGGGTRPGRVECAVGRLAARSLAEANTMVDKIVEYETASVNDAWKLRTTVVADDGPAGVGSNGEIVNDRLLHTLQAEAISNLVPPLFEKKKIFTYEYPTLYTPAGRRKPDVNVALRSQINQGTLVLNFTGHGNPRVWTDEQVFVRETDFPGLTNKGKYFFLSAATCNYSHFDMLNEQSGGEDLVARPNAGAIGVFSATRPVFASDNFEINKTFFRFLFQRDVNGNLIHQRIGDVMFNTQQVHFSGLFDNDRKFFLLGDPALRIAYPDQLASIDSINHLPPSQTALLQALGRASVIATVRDTGTNLPVGFLGQAQVVVFDADRTVVLAPTDISESMTYKIPGNVLFRGEQSVTNGIITSEFIVPKDISYGNDYGRMTVYFWNGSTDGAGYSTNFRVGGTDSTAPADAIGPTIALFLDDSTHFRPGDVVSLSPTLLANLFDSSGINTSGAGVGHRLEVWLDNASASVDVSDYYRSKNNSFREGVVQYPLGELSHGTHKLRLRAWDTYNNSNVQETNFDVVTSQGLRLTNIFNFPNPMRSNTIFTFEQNQLSGVDAEIKIYTVAGRLIQTLQTRNINDAFVQIPWDGRDRDGDELANGVYLYKIIVKTSDGRFTSEALGKMSIVR